MLYCCNCASVGVPEKASNRSTAVTPGSASIWSLQLIRLPGYVSIGDQHMVLASRRRSCRCWRRRGRSLTGVSDFQAVRERGRATGEGRSRAGGACLHTARLIAATVRSCSVDDIKGGLTILVEHHFEVGRGCGIGKVRRPPLNVKLPVRRAAGCGGENATGSARETRAASEA